MDLGIFLSDPGGGGGGVLVDKVHMADLSGVVLGLGLVNQTKI